MQKRRQLPLVALVGRPNVGKSTFFNRLLGKRRSLVQDRPGVTRDRMYGEADYLGRHFLVVDTGGFEPDVPEGHIYRHVRDQAMLAIDEADVILFFVDGREGINPSDHEVASLLRTGTDKPILCVVNKIDTPEREAHAWEFYQLGLSELFPISAETGHGGDDLLDALLPLLPEPEPADEVDDTDEATLAAAAEAALAEEGWEDEGGDTGASLDEEDDDTEWDETEWDDAAGAETPADALDPDFTLPTPRRRRRETSGPAHTEDEGLEARIALIGRPNVGKSSLANRLLGEERQIAHDTPGTTRDSIDIDLEWGGNRYVLTDTAGVRKAARISDKLEKYTVIKAFKALSSADTAVLLIDPIELITSQEQRLAGMAAEKSKALVLAVNKWDLMKGQGIERSGVEQALRDRLPFVDYAPICFISAQTGYGVDGLMKTISAVKTQFRQSIGTSALNSWLRQVTEAVVPSIFRGKPIRFMYMTQVRTSPPTFLIFVNHPEGVKPDYRRYLMNQLRQSFALDMTPVRLVLRSRG